MDQNADVLTESGRFVLEKDLVTTLRVGLPHALNLSSRWHQVLHEVTVRSNVADLVYAHAATPPAGKPARVTYFEASIIAVVLQLGEAPVHVIAEELYASSPLVEARMPKLIRTGLVECAGTNVRATGSHLAQEVQLLAIEAKLTRWRDAIDQATRYRVFANEAYVAMPMEMFVKNDGILPACEAAGVGALAVTIDGLVTPMIPAHVSAPQSPEWVRLLSSSVGFAHALNAFAQTR